MPGGPGMAAAQVGNDWTFSMRNLSDAVVIRTGTPQGWTLKSVLLNSQDITDTPMEFPPGQTVNGMQIVLTKKISSLSGLITDSKSNPVLDATVIVFPADERLWTYQSRFIKAARPEAVPISGGTDVMVELDIDYFQNPLWGWIPCRWVTVRRKAAGALWRSEEARLTAYRINDMPGKLPLRDATGRTSCR